MCEVQGLISSGRVPSHSRALKQRYQSHWPTIVSAFKESTRRSQLPDKGALYREKQGWMALPFNETACATVDRTFVTLRKLWDATDEGL
jgi:hypothetical protein